MPGVRPSKAQVRGMTPPPRSIIAGAAVRVQLRCRPLLVRFFSAAATAGAVGLTRESPLPDPVLPEPPLQAARAPVPAAPSPASRTATGDPVRLDAVSSCVVTADAVAEGRHIAPSGAA